MVSHLKLKPPIDVESVVFALGIILHTEPFDDEVSGFHYRSKKCRCHIVVNSRHHRHRQKVTALHEVGHFLLNRLDQGKECTRLLVHGKASECEKCGVCTNDPLVIEAFCTRLAACILVPASRLTLMVEMNRMPRRYLVEPFAKLFGVSCRLMELRMEELGLMED
jgi:Zn-dependent peptidase ImmA (M78 family)